MEFRLLGPFEARDRGAVVAVGSRRQERCLLALLLLAPGRHLTAERIADLLWDGRPPPSARGAIHTYVGRLRRSLAPYDVIITTRADGYLVEPGPHTIDVDEFTALVREATAISGPGDQVRLCDGALRLWRGPLLADVADDNLRARLDPSLTELRLIAAQARAEAQLSMGLHDRVVAELPAIVDTAPTREQLLGSLMVGLYRDGRPAEALGLYVRTRTALADEFGIEPGRELRSLYQRILRDDPSLQRPPMAVYAVRVADQWLRQPSGHPVLEFCNTYAGWAAPGRRGADWLREYATLAVWAGHYDLADAATVDDLRHRAQQEPVTAAATLEQARDLRTVLYACLTHPDDQDTLRVRGHVCRGRRPTDHLPPRRGPARPLEHPGRGGAAVARPRDRPGRGRPACRPPPDDRTRVSRARVWLAVARPRRATALLQHRDLRRQRAIGPEVFEVGVGVTWPTTDRRSVVAVGEYGDDRSAKPCSRTHRSWCRSMGPRTCPGESDVMNVRRDDWGQRARSTASTGVVVGGAAAVCRGRGGCPTRSLRGTGRRHHRYRVSSTALMWPCSAWAHWPSRADCPATASRRWWTAAVAVIMAVWSACTATGNAWHCWHWY